MTSQLLLLSLLSMTPTEEMAEAARCFFTTAETETGCASGRADQAPYLAKEPSISSVKGVRSPTFKVKLGNGKWMTLQGGDADFNAIVKLRSLNGYFGHASWYGEHSSYFLLLADHPTILYFKSPPVFGPGNKCAISVAQADPFLERGTVSIESLLLSRKKPEYRQMRVRTLIPEGELAHDRVDTVEFTSATRARIIYTEPLDAGSRVQQRVKAQSLVYDCESGKAQYGELNTVERWGTAYINTPGVNLRGGASAQSKVKYVLPYGLSLQLLSQPSKRWFEVQLPGGIVGYVAADFVTASGAGNRCPIGVHEKVIEYHPKTQTALLSKSRAVLREGDAHALRELRDKLEIHQFCLNYSATTSCREAAKALVTLTHRGLRGLAPVYAATHPDILNSVPQFRGNPIACHRADSEGNIPHEP